MESEAISIDKYLDSDVSQRFEFLYENYSVLKAIIKDYREDIINDVIDICVGGSGSGKKMKKLHMHA